MAKHLKQNKDKFKKNAGIINYEMRKLKAKILNLHNELTRT